ncbi:MAG TPA: PQQ-binding-like beta-propeller repeat protein [Tepidisphaeraceae bacterium]
MPRSLIIRSVVFLCALCVSAVSYSEDWPQWRGPRGDGTSTDTTIPTKWSATENIKWKVPVPGKGHGSASIAGGRILLNTCIESENRRVLMCLDQRDGHTLWQRDVLIAPLEKKHPLNSYASSTPLVADGRVYVTFLDIGITSAGQNVRPNTKTNGQVLVAAYDLAGNEVWRKHVGKFSSMHGWSCSPIAWKDNLIVNCDHDGDGYIVCLKCSTGDEVWRIPRPNHTRSYCNPTIFDVNGSTHMVLSGSKCTADYDPDTGQQRWLIDGPTEQFCASMVYGDGLFFITAGFPTYHTLGITPAGQTAWHLKGASMAAYVPSPVFANHCLFLVTDEGKPSRGVCLDGKSGRVLWSHTLGDHHRPSALLANGNVYWLSDEGTTYVVKAADKFELIAENPLNEPANAAPAIADGHLYIRTDHHLWCIGAP